MENRLLLALISTVLERIGLLGRLEVGEILSILLLVLWCGRLLAHLWHSSLSTFMELPVFVVHITVCVQSPSQVTSLKLSGLLQRVQRLRQGLGLVRVILQTDIRN
jgi:hypothetical protein